MPARPRTYPQIPGFRRPQRPGRAGRRLGLLVALAAVAFAASALIPGSHAARSTVHFGVARTAHRSSSRDPLPVHLSTVFGSSASASRYGVIDAERENGWVDPQGHLTSDLTPLPPGVFTGPIASYRRYAERLAAALSGSVATLQAALRAGDRRAAERAWAAAYFDFMRLGADYNLLPVALSDALAEVPPRDDAPRFPGLHRIERGLWTGRPPATLVPVALELARATRRLRRLLPTIRITPLTYTLRIHEILEDAQRDLLSGTDVPWSGAGVLGTEAGVLATRKLLATVRPIIEGRDNSYVESRNWLDQLQRVLLGVRRRDGSWPTIHQLTRDQHERIDATLAGTLGALDQVPGALETRSIDDFPSIPTRGRRSG